MTWNQGYLLILLIFCMISVNNCSGSEDKKQSQVIDSSGGSSGSDSTTTTDCPGGHTLVVSVNDDFSSTPIQGATVTIGRTYAITWLDSSQRFIVSCSTSNDLGTKTTDANGNVSFNTNISLYWNDSMYACTSRSGYWANVNSVSLGSCGSNYASAFLQRKL